VQFRQSGRRLAAVHCCPLSEQRDEALHLHMGLRSGATGCRQVYEKTEIFRFLANAETFSAIIR
jgi:hypothetical protein